TLLQLGIGEALVSVLDETGVPTMVERCTILPPQSLMSPLDDAEREKLIQNHLLYVRYSQTEDRDSAYEFLQRKFLADAESAQAAKEAAAAEKQRLREEAAAKKEAEKKEAAKNKQIKSAAKNVASSAAGTIGREIGNSVGSSIGGKFGKKLGGNLGASLGRNILGTLFGK
ncbi:MAG: DUF853 domain-containing protein, partial [Lachnospiraceae bacterium]|nr:DUF853 domain-containing protein [Lachnospiraceae bacterium]